MRVLDHVDEGGHVVVGDPLAFGDLGHEGGVDLGARARTAAASAAGTTPDLGQPLDRQQLDLEPRAEAGLVGEQGGHVGRACSGGSPPSPAWPGAR